MKFGVFIVLIDLVGLEFECFERAGYVELVTECVFCYSVL